MTTVTGTFTPAPGRAPMRTILRQQVRMELLLTARRGEAVVLAMGVPLLVLLGAVLTRATNVPTDDRPGYVVPGVLALTVMSTAFTGQAITTGYERSYGVLKRLGASPLTRPGLIFAKTAAILLSLGVDQAQGFLYSQAVPAADLPLVSAVPRPRRGRRNRTGSSATVAVDDRPVRHARPPRPPRPDDPIG